MTEFTRTFPKNPERLGLARIVPDVVFTQRPGADLKLQLILPQTVDKEIAGDKRCPAVLFVQGSGWTFPDVWYEIAQLSRLAQRGIAVATITHRSTKDGHAAPAFLEDVKTGIRFLREYADRFHIDPERIGIWGTSSGGNAALLTALTMDDKQYRTHEYEQQSDRVAVCVDTFGPADVYQQFGEADPVEAEFFARQLVGNYSETFSIKDLEFMSPAHLVKEGMDLPPFLLMHGTADSTVGYEQSVTMHEKLLEHGYESDLVTVTDGEHEGDFWSQELFEHVFNYLEAKLGAIES